MYGYIYKTTNLSSGKVYIGKCASSKFDSSYKGSGTYIRRALNKHGTDNFSVIQIDSAENLRELNAKEIFWIAFYRNQHFDMYNISNGGDGGDTYAFMSLEDRQARIDLLRKVGYFSNYSTEEARRNSLKGWETRRRNGYVVSVEARRHMSESHKGKVPDPEVVKRIFATRKANGYRHTPETIEKIRQGNLGKVISEDVRRRISEAQKGKRTGKDNPFYGKHHTQETKNKLRRYNQLGICGAKGSIWVNNSIVNKRIKPSELEMYISNGYVKGRMHFKHKPKGE